ncbi:hypothetical protein UFOVP178_1 [uncultured Caudovirales phage]|uniref:Uncharacterized protein n=1 Tax=uncultured Caudovirales phage TaxID=2100421 RepID=A0A6J7WDW7_9CAUD|nr:hypothetical protein UFOVP178_1 [uncultured Caudovirales phage]
MTAQQYILDLVEWESTNGYSTADLIRHWCNCQEVEITEQGNVWIANPQTGHTLEDNELAKFVEWHKSQIN